MLNILHILYLTSMQVIKRNNIKENVSFDKIFNRINSLVNINDHQLSNKINSYLVCRKTIELMTDEIKTTDLDILSADICANLITTHSDYGYLGARILISNLKKNLEVKYKVSNFYGVTNLIVEKIPTYLNTDYVIFVTLYENQLNKIINDNYNYTFDYFGFKTLEKSYLIKDIKTKETYEDPQSMWLRVSITIHMRSNLSIEDKLNKIKETYEMMAQGKFTHATPTLFNAGTNHEQLSSCFLLGTDDSLEGILKTYVDCGRISKWAGGIGIHVSNIRARGQLIKSTNGESNGIVPMLAVLNKIAKQINQGGKRNGSIAIYLEPWHSDIIEYLELRKNGGNEEEKCRDLFLALWIPDKFMEAVYTKSKWYLMSENECPGLTEVYGEEFNKLYDKYVSEGKYTAEINAKDIWDKILTSQIETGTPYIAYKDHVNKKSNQKNLGTIKSSNLCIEIMEYSDDKEYAVCNLASIAVNKFYDEKTKIYNYGELHKTAKIATYNLNNIIDINYYPTNETRYSNLKNRPIGVGIQGFADLLAIMKLPFEDPKSIDLSSKLLETIYHGCTEMSNELAQIYGPYESYNGSPISQGLFQFDLWDKQDKLSGIWDWNTLRENILKHGVRNSLTTALMPTASTSQILGNNECFEPFTSNLYSRLTLAGNFVVFNKHLQKDLEDLGLWNEQMKNKLMTSYGSVQKIKEIPEDIRAIYKTVWEIKNKSLIDHAIARGPFVDQSQSMNLYFAEPDALKLTSALMYGWKNGLKSGMYYLRSLSSSNAQQFTVEPTVIKTKSNINTVECEICSA
jgi:ribonucleoside-diphosphate reductase alpha subunit